MSLVKIMDDFETAIGASADDSINLIARRFALAQSRCGVEAALTALATVYVIAEQRRRYLEADRARGHGEEVS